MRAAVGCMRACCCMAAWLSILASTGCVAARFDRAVGQPKEHLLDLVGPPTQVVQSANGTEIWVYPTSRIVDTGLPLENEDTIGDAFQKGLAEGISESIMDSVFLPGGPYRYVVVDREGRVQSWELKVWPE